MPVSTMQPSFSGGELAPSLHARVDLAKYATGLKTCRNFLVQAHGGVANRAGTKFVAETANMGYASRLIPFEFNTTQTYVLEFSHLVMRVFKEGGQIALAANPHAWSSGQAYDITQTDPSNGAYPWVRHANANYVLKKVSLASGQSNPATDQNNGAVNWHPLRNAAGNSHLIVEIVTPYTAAQLKDINFTQSADVMTIVHPSHPVQELNRYSHYNWFLSAI